MAEWNLCPVISYNVHDEFCDYKKTHSKFQIFLQILSAELKYKIVRMETFSQNVYRGFLSLIRIIF